MAEDARLAEYQPYWAARAASPGAIDRARIARSAQQDRFKVHATVDDPMAADLILFFEPEDACLARRRVLWQLLEPYNFRRKLLPGMRRLLSG